jgi:phage shock protein A
MDTVITEYQKWKQHGESLRVQARQAMEARYRDLLTEAVRIAQEYHTDFGVALKPPPAVTAFRYKSAAGKAKKAVKTAVATPRPTNDPKIAALEKKLAQTRGKMEAARAAGKSTKNLDDRIYEIEDEIRLAGQAG